MTCTSARRRASGRVGCGHAAKVSFGFCLESQLFWAGFGRFEPLFAPPEAPEYQIILAKCPNTVWVLHREKVVLGVTLSCYVVLGSRVVLCCVARSELR